MQKRLPLLLVLGFWVEGNWVAHSFTLVSPIHDSKISGILEIRVDDSNYGQDRRVEFYINKAGERFRELKCAPERHPYLCRFSSCQFSNGQYQITAEAEQSNGWLDQDIVAITIQNNDLIPPVSVKIVSPEEGVIVTEYVAVDVFAIDLECGVKGVGFYVDDSYMGKGAPLPNNPLGEDYYRWMWETVWFKDGKHVLKAVAYDWRQNEAASDPVEFIVDNTPPVISDVRHYVYQTSATIAWATDEPATSEVWFSIPKFPWLPWFVAPNSNTNLVKEHRVFLEDIPTGAEHLYQVQSADQVGNSATSDNFRFTTPPFPRFIRGDVNANGELDIGDSAATLDFLYHGSTKPSCLKAADVDDNGLVDITDPIYTLSYLFNGSKLPPKPPYPKAGIDPTPDDLDCDP